MKEFWNAVQFVFTAVGGWLGYFLGGCDGLLFALLAFVVIDYITGVMCAISDQKLSSAVGFKGICRKVLIFLMVGIANILDVYVIGLGDVSRHVLQVVQQLRHEGFVAEGNLVQRGLKAQFKSADRKKAKYIVIIGEDEAANGTVNFKVAGEKEQITLRKEEVSAHVKELEAK